MANRKQKTEQQITHAQIVEILSAWQTGVRPKSRLSVSEWAEKHRVLPSTNIASGRWENKRTPYLTEIMDSLSERNPARVVVVMAGAQVGKSEAGYNTIGYWIDECPANIILALPTEKLYRMVSGSRINPLITLTDTLRDKFTAGGTVEYKRFVGGALHMVTAKSAPSLRSMAARYVIADECDAYPFALAGEGDPLSLLRKRMSTYEWQSKFLITSTPLLKDSSRVAAYIEQTDYRKYHVGCLACGHEQPIEWEGIKWDDDKPETVRWECGECRHAHYENDKTALLAAGRWIGTKDTENLNWVGFHLSALYSPYGWYSWRQAVEEYIAGRNDEYKRQAWTNTVLGLPYKHYGYRPTISSETINPERYDNDAHAPAECLVLTAGVDTQGDRVEVYVWGWMDGEKPCLVDFQVLMGDLSQDKFWSDVYFMLDDARYKTADGREMRINSVCIDTGGIYTTEVYRFVNRSHDSLFDNMFAIKGVAGYNRPIIGEAPRLIKHKKQNVGVVQLWTVGVDPCKTTLYKKINAGEVRVPIALPNGEIVSKEFYKQLVAETQQKEYKNGFPRHVWVKEYPRNEALDCWVYAYAALKALNVDWEYIISHKGENPEK